MIFTVCFKDALVKCRKQIMADLDVAYIIDFLVENKVIDDQAYLHIKSEVGAFHSFQLMFNYGKVTWEIVDEYL